MNSEKEQLKEYQEHSKDRLEKVISKKILTTTVGSVALIEEFFKKNFEDDDEMLKEFDKIRTAIFDLGNKQIKNAKNEINEYIVYWKRKTVQLDVKKKD